MDHTLSYVIAAALGGLIGGLGHALISDNPGFGSGAPGTTRDFSGYRDLAVGFFSGLVWLLPNQTTWFTPAASPNPIGSLVLIGLQTMIIGLAGSGWLTSYLDNGSLKSAVVLAAQSQPNASVANQISATNSVAEITDLVHKL